MNSVLLISASLMHWCIQLCSLLLLLLLFLGLFFCVQWNIKYLWTWTVNEAFSLATSVSSWYNLWGWPGNIILIIKSIYHRMMLFSSFFFLCTLQSLQMMGMLGKYLVANHTGWLCCCSAVPWDHIICMNALWRQPSNVAYQPTVCAQGS